MSELRTDVNEFENEMVKMTLGAIIRLLNAGDRVEAAMGQLTLYPTEKRERRAWLLIEDMFRPISGIIDMEGECSGMLIDAVWNKRDLDAAMSAFRLCLAENEGLATEGCPVDGEYD